MDRKKYVDDFVYLVYYLINNTKETLGPMNKIKNVLVEIPIRTDARPVIQPYRRVPVPLEAAVDLLAQAIIEVVNGPSQWISSVVPVPNEADQCVSASAH